MVARRLVQSARDAKRRRCATRVSDVSSRQTSIAATNAFGSSAATSIAPSALISFEYEQRVATTGFPIARYSLIFVGTDVRIKSFSRYGTMPTSNPSIYDA